MFVAQLPKFHVPQGLERNKATEMLEVNIVMVNAVLFCHLFFIYIASN
jgi:hypothetical protein